MKKHLGRAAIEIGFIIFLFYSNLLMGEYMRSGAGRREGFVMAVEDILTPQNFLIALIAAIIGYLLFEWLRTKY
jgi:hypothetical protein